jgi:ABC-2 type transport system permease protein
MSLSRSFAILRNELRVLRRDPTPLIILIAMPLIVLPIFRSTFRAVLVLSGRPHASGAEFAVPGEVVQFLFYLSPTVGFAFFREHGWGTWERLRASAATSAEIITGKALPMVALGAAQLVVLFGVGVLLLDLHVRGSVAGVVVVSAALLACVVALGVAITAISRTIQQVSAFGYLGATVFGAVGGALVPFSTLPGWVRAIAPVTPQYWAMRGYSAMILDGRSFGAAIRPTLMLLGYAVAFVAVALARFRFDDAKVAWA